MRRELKTAAMTTERSYFTLNLPTRPKDGDKIQVVAKLKSKPKL